MKTYRFIIALFGNKHVGMLLTNLYSIKENAPRASVTVLWQDVDPKTKEDLQKVFPEVDFQEINFDISSDKIKRISSKMLFWNYAVSKFKGEQLCLVDVDTLILKDIGDFFEEDFDILFTDKKEEIFPLNTGVMLCKGEKSHIFFEKWMQTTIEILSDETLIHQAMSTQYPFGGGDQMSFYNLVEYTKEKSTFEVTIGDQPIRLVSKPCALLNETRSTIISPMTHIVHYKGGWQMVMLEGEDFTRNRSKKDSWEMYLLYLNTHKQALNYLNTHAKTHYEFGSFGIQIPCYLDKIHLKENKVRYFFFHMYSLIKRIIKFLKI